MLKSLVNVGLDTWRVQRPKLIQFSVTDMTKEEIISSCVLFFSAGYETTSTVFSMILYCLALNPQVQERLHREIEETISKLASESAESEDDPFKLVTLDTLPRFEYLTAVFHESLRLYPPGSFNERACIRDTVLRTEDNRYRVHVKKGKNAIF